MKRSVKLLLAGLVLALMAGCAPKPAAVAQAPARQVAPLLTTPEAQDVHSYARPAEARVTNVDLDLAADFTRHQLAGTARLAVQAAAADPSLILDTRDLAIESVSDAAGRPLTWSLGKADAILGAPLTVQLGSVRELLIRYHTSPDAAALQWLPPSQTAGKQHPYLFSQGEAILTRTWVPTQDSPGIRQTWSARITAPAELRVVMSAEQLTPEGEMLANGRVWRFVMDKPVAPYLIAIAIGDLAFQPLGERTGVYTEPSRLKAAASELADVEAMVKAAESLYGPYRWGRYDLLVLPPSFPFGGMENPRLTFATPTVIAGDKSLVSLVAHELAHSWSGNLVTNATWSDFWLNEGFTTYFENRIMERVYGPADALMLADLGWDGLQAQIKSLGAKGLADTRLHIDLAGRDPDDGMTDIAYEKGAAFLRTIETAVGRQRWDEYLRSYFDRHAFAPQTTAGFLADLHEHLLAADPALEDRILTHAWAYDTGLPANAVAPRSSRLAAVDKLAAAFVRQGAKAAPGASKWTTAERVRFINRLPRKLPVTRLAELDKLLGLAQQGNSEVRFAWLRLAVANHYAPAVPQLEDFLTSMGRRKFVLPLFSDLMAQGTWGQPIAQRIYALARPGYHSVTVGSVDKIVPVSAAR
jgi:aminopeptidase N